MLPVLKHAFTRRIFATLVFELIALNICFTVLVQMRAGLWQQANSALGMTACFGLVSTLLVQFALWSFGLYSREVVYSGVRLFSNLAGAFVFSALLLFPSCYLFSLAGNDLFSFTFRFYVFALLGFMSLIAMERFLVLKLFDDTPYLGNVLVLGTGPATEKLIHESTHEEGKAFRLGAILSERSIDIGKEIDGHRVVGTLDDFPRVLHEGGYNTVLISSSVYSPALPINALLRSKVGGTQILDAGDFYESKNRKILLEKLEPVQLLLSENLRMTRLRWFMKDSQEKLTAIVLLSLTWPLMLAAAIAIKLSSRGPLFYRQTRVGMDGRRFEVIKFRTMRTDAESDGRAQWAQKNDPRVTWVGRILRKTRIDELPQIFNVLAGNMAFVGPRPERPEFVELLKQKIPFYDQRHLVKPGITGWAQVCYPYGASVEDAREKLRYDLYYIKHMSFFFDLMVVLATVRTVLFKSYGQ